MIIQPKLTVPDGDECGGCDRRYRDVCLLFDEWVSEKNERGLSYRKKLPQCRAAEVKEPTDAELHSELNYHPVTQYILSRPHAPAWSLAMGVIGVMEQMGYRIQEEGNGAEYIRKLETKLKFLIRVYMVHDEYEADEKDIKTEVTFNRIMSE